MDRQQEFKDRAAKVAELFCSIGRAKPVKIVSHFDADGISACAIIIKAMNILGYAYNATIVKQLTQGVVYDLSHDKADTIIFCDMGSGEIDRIAEILKGKQIFIIDHHRISGSTSDVVLLNPEQFGISGSKELSASGAAYFLYRQIAKKKNTAHIALVGAIGDYQEHNGLSGFNKEILEDAKSQGLVKVAEGLRISCSESALINKALEFSLDPLIPGISGSEASAVKFLQELTVGKQGYRWKKFSELGEKEAKIIASAVIEKRRGVDKFEDIFGPVYFLPKEKNEAMKNAAEYANLLDACGRMEKASVGLGACLGDETSKMRALSILNQYKRELLENFQWFDKARKNRDSTVIEEKGYVIINAKSRIRDTMLGALATVLTSSPEYAKGKLIMTLGYDADMIKVSLRAAGKLNVDLKRILELMVLPVKGTCGGHKNAAGGRLEKGREEEFTENAKHVLEKFSAEETVS